MKSNTFLVPKKITTKNLSIASILLSLSLLLNLYLMFYVPFAGFHSIKITLATSFIMITGITCGPVFGFASGCLLDIITCMIRPVGPYFPGFTLVAGLSGLIPFVLYKLFKNKKLPYNLINSLFILLLSTSCVVGFIYKNLLLFKNNTLYYDGKVLSMWYIIAYISITILYIIVPIILTNKFSKTNINTSKILCIVSITECITSLILNTYNLSLCFGKGFILFLPGRILSCMFMIPIHTIILCALIEILNKIYKYNL